MPLTDLNLVVDTHRPGWRRRALAEGAARLREAQRPQMAAALLHRGQSEAEPLALLQEFFRLHQGFKPIDPASMALPRGGAARCASSEAAAVERPDVAWQGELPSRLVGEPVVLEDMVIALGLAGEVYLYDLHSGDFLASHPVPNAGGSVAGIAAAGHRLFVSAAFDLICLDIQSGAELWRSAAAEWAPHPVTLCGPYLLASSRKGWLCCLNAQSGEELWRVQPDGGNALSTPPAVCGEKVVVGSASGTVFGYSLHHGVLRWKQGLGASVATAAAVADGCCVLSSGDGYLHALELRNGKILWDHPGPSAYWREVTIGAGVVVAVASSGAEILCLGLRDGQVRWSRAMSPAGPASPVICGEEVFFGSDSGALNRFELVGGARGAVTHHGPIQETVTAGGYLLLAVSSRQSDSLRCLVTEEEPRWP